MSRTGLLFILLAFAAGGGIGFMGGAGSGDVILQTSGNGGADDSRAPPEPELPPMPDAPSTGYTSLEHALESIPYGPSADGEGMFSGTIRTEDGKPLKGVLVRATYRPDRRGKAYRQGAGVPEDKDLEEYAKPGSDKCNAMVEKIREKMGVTSLRYQRLDDLVEAFLHDGQAS